MALLLAAACWLQTRAAVEFQIGSHAPVEMQIYHSATGVFSERQSLSITVDPARDGSVRIRVPAANAAHLRLDPSPESAPFNLCKLHANGVSYRQGLANDLIWRAGESCVLIASKPGAADPFLILQADKPATTASGVLPWSIAAYLLFTLSLIALYLAIKSCNWPETRFSAGADSMFDALSRHAHRLVFVLMLVLGGTIALALPPNGVPDEEAHMSKIAKLYSGMWLSDSGAVPVVSVADMYGPLWGRMPSIPRTVLDAQLNKPLSCAKSPQTLLTTADRYAPHLYLLPTAVLAVSCGLESTFGTFLTTARILNLILGALLIAIGVRCATYGKWALFVVALLPMTLSQVASISADSLTLALSFCFLGLVSGIAGGRLRPAQVRYWLPAIAVLLAFAKPGAAWILIAVVFCRGAYLREGQSFAKAVVACVLIPWILHAGWVLWSAQGAFSGPGVVKTDNMSLLLSDPGLVVTLGMNTYFGEHAVLLYRSMIGVLGWLDVHLSPWAYVLGGAALGASLWTNSSAPGLTPAIRTACLMFALGSLAVLGLPLFLTWTDPNSGIIQGLQGRYFLPTVAFVLVWCGFRATPVLRLALLALVLTSPLLAFDAVLHINQRYYPGASLF